MCETKEIRDATAGTANMMRNVLFTRGVYSRAPAEGFTKLETPRAAKPHHVLGPRLLLPRFRSSSTIILYCLSTPEHHRNQELALERHAIKPKCPEQEKLASKQRVKKQCVPTSPPYPHVEDE